MVANYPNSLIHFGRNLGATGYYFVVFTYYSKTEIRFNNWILFSVDYRNYNVKKLDLFSAQNDIVLTISHFGNH